MAEADTMEPGAITVPETPKQGLEQRAEIILKSAQQLQIATDMDNEAAAAFMRRCKQLAKEIKDLTDPAVKKAHEAHKEAKRMQHAMLKPVEDARRLLARKSGEYIERQRALEKAEEEMIREQARKAAEAEAHATAEEIEAGGNADVAEDYRKGAELVGKQAASAVNFESNVHRPKGVKVRTDWKFEVTDVSAVPREWLIPDEKAIGAYVRSRKGEAKIPGVRVYSETQSIV